MKIKIEIVGMSYVTGPAISYGELHDDGIIDIRLPYFVNPDVIRAIENGYCNGQMKGEVIATDSQGGTTSGKYLWEILR